MTAEAMATVRVQTKVRSRFLGELSNEPGSELFLPAGIPGFESEHSLLPVEIPAYRPLVFLQSTERPDVCFICLPVSSIDPDFSIVVGEDDRATLGLPAEGELVAGEDILCLALLLPLPGAVRTNLDAPIVINLRTYLCAQVVLTRCNGSRRLAADGRWEREC